MSVSEVFAQQLINGISVGMMYGLMAIGLTLIYGIMELINFAHFSIFVVGAFTALEILTRASSGATMVGTPAASVLPIMIFAFLGAIIVPGILGLGLERMLRAFRGATGVGPMIASLGVAYVLSDALMLIKGPQNFLFPSPIPRLSWAFGNVQLRLKEVMVWVVCILMMFVLYFIVWKTPLGRAMRATRDDAEAAQMMGVEVDKIRAFTFFVSSALAGVAGLVFGLYYGQINFRSGYGIGLRAFTASVLGGIGNPLGSVVGGVIIGLIEAIGGQIIGVGWTAIIVFSLLIITLLFLPNGLFGSQVGRRA